MQGDLAGALASYRARLQLNERAAAADPDDRDKQWRLWGSHILIGEVLQHQGRLADALASFSTAQDVAERGTKAEPASPVAARNLARSYSGVAGVRQAKGDRPGALALWRKALALVEASAAAIEQEESKSTSKAAGTTADALAWVEWEAVLARAPAKALWPGSAPACWCRISAPRMKSTAGTPFCSATDGKRPGPST